MDVLLLVVSYIVQKPIASRFSWQVKTPNNKTKKNNTTVIGGLLFIFLMWLLHIFTSLSSPPFPKKLRCARFLFFFPFPQHCLSQKGNSIFSKIMVLEWFPSTQLVGREVLQTFSKFFHGFFMQSHLILIIVYW